MNKNYQNNKEVKTLCTNCKHAIEPLEVRKYGFLVAFMCPHCSFRWDRSTVAKYKRR